VGGNTGVSCTLHLRGGEKNEGATGRSTLKNPICKKVGIRLLWKRGPRTKGKPEEISGANKKRVKGVSKFYQKKKKKKGEYD